MRGRLLVAAVVALALVGAGAGALVVLDGVPAFGGDDDSSASESADRETATDRDADYALDIERLERCGRTCREVTATLTNEGSSPRRNVTVETEVYADGDEVWSGEESVGRLGPGGSHTSTKRVTVGYVGGMKIRLNDGYVTIVTVIESNSGTTRLSERRKVA